MHIFDVLFGGKRRITEENVSAFLAWMLDPGQSHGWGGLFLSKFLRAVDQSAFEVFLRSLSGGAVYREKENKPAGVTVVMEEPVTTTEDSRRDLDVVLYLNPEHGLPKFVLIENKIRSGSVSKNQLRDELNGFLNSESEFQRAAEDVALVYLTLDKGTNSLAEFETVSEHAGLKRHLVWQGEEDDSIESIIEEILIEDGKGFIDPLFSETKWLLKSFLRMIRSGFETRYIDRTDTAGFQTEYFAGQAQGIEELRFLVGQNPDIYIGFQGGLKALEKASREYLEQRTYKYDTDKARGNKNPKNWLEAPKVIEIYDSKL